MARPQRNNVDYFPHYISDGKKMFFIEQKYGNDGYATWFKVLEKLAETDYHYLNLNDESELMYLSAKCRVSEDTLLSVLNDLSKLGAINSEMWDNRIIWSDKFIDSIEDAYAKRSNDCQTLEGLRGHLLSLGLLKGSVKPQTKVKETKVKETKVNQGVFFPFDSDSFLEVWNQWKEYKKREHRFNYKSAQSEQAALKKLAELSGDDEQLSIKIIMQSIENGWKGFFEYNQNGKQRLSSDQKQYLISRSDL